MREKMVRDFLLKFFLKECEKILKKKNRICIKLLFILLWIIRVKYYYNNNNNINDNKVWN